MPTGVARVRSRAWRRAGARPGGADRRRPGHRQVDAPPPGARVDERFAQGDLRDRRGIGRADRAAGAAPAGRHRRRACSSPRSSSSASRRRSRPRSPRSRSSTRSRRYTRRRSTSAPGSVAQVRDCAAQLTRLAKRIGTALVFVGHVTKEGALAGPRVLEHIVDTVLYFEGDPNSSFRLIRAFKNRFGPVNELGVFAMTEKGLAGGHQPLGAVPLAAPRAGARLVHPGHQRGNAAAAGRECRRSSTARTA